MAVALNLLKKMSKHRRGRLAQARGSMDLLAALLGEILLLGPSD